METPDLGSLIQKALEEAMRERGHANVLIAAERVNDNETPLFKV